VKLEQTHTQLEAFALSGTSPPSSNAVEKICERILNYLSLQTRPSHEAEILSSVRGRRQYKITALRDLIAASIVARSGSGKKGNPYLYSLSNARQIQQGNTFVEEIIL
jgi:hypothetical protein